MHHMWLLSKFRYRQYVSPVYVRNHTERHTDLQGLEDGLSVGHEDGEGFGTEAFGEGSEWFQGFQTDLKKHKHESQCVEAGSIATSTSNMIYSTMLK